MYKHREFSGCLNLLEVAKINSKKSSAHLLRYHALIMQELYGPRDEAASEDTHWSKLRDHVCEAQQFLTSLGNTINSWERSKLEGRYEELGQIAERLTVASKLGGPHGARLIDILAGLCGPSGRSPRYAALLLWAKYEATRFIQGPSRACQEALCLPEQIFRVWVFWRLGLNFYEAPSSVQDVWNRAKRIWDSGDIARKHSLIPVEPGKQFSSFRAFACFALAYLQLRSDNEAQGDQDLAELTNDLPFYEQVRNDKAHAWAATPEKHRRKYFGLIKSWLDHMLGACPEPDPVNEESLRMVLEPLPLVEW